MIKFVTIIDGKAMLYTKYDSGGCYVKPILGGKSTPISTHEFETTHEQAKQDIQNTYYTEVVK